MKIEIHVSDDKKSYSISFDGGTPVRMDNFILLTKEGESTRNLVFGNAENVGRLLYGLYVNCWRLQETAMRDMIELVADDILDVRGKRNRSSRATIRKFLM
ncbi:MAG: hypothetical protein HZA60_07985 [Deltaproteobacteria bacterium]|nr:hypothetical protein [Deltaproteobacteria bacterium]